MGTILSDLGLGFLTSDISQASSTVYDRMQNNEFEKVFGLSVDNINSILNAYVTIGNGYIFNPNTDSTQSINQIQAKINLQVSGYNANDAIYYVLYELYFASQDMQSYSAPCLRVLNQNTTNNAGVPGKIQSQGGGGSPTVSKSVQKTLSDVGTSIKSLFAGLGISVGQLETILIVIAVILLIVNIMPLVKR